MRYDKRSLLLRVLTYMTAMRYDRTPLLLRVLTYMTAIRYDERSRILRVLTATWKDGMTMLSVPQRERERVTATGNGKIIFHAEETLTAVRKDQNISPLENRQCQRRRMKYSFCSENLTAPRAD